ncbi:tail fiber assembly protein [Enterobacter hormaechei]
MNYWFSPANNAFYPVALKESYVNAGSLPNDLIEVEDSVFSEFSATPPEGKLRGIGSDGFPIWIDIPLWIEIRNKHAPVLCAMNSSSVQIECLFLITLSTMFY